MMLEETKLSPEQFGRCIGVSGMSIRRWLKQAPGKTIPKIYSQAIMQAVYQMLLEGRLDRHSKSAQWVVRESQSISFQAVLKNLGLEHPDVLQNPQDLPYEDRLMANLAQIGASDARRAEVGKSRKKIIGFQKLSKDWREKIAVLLRAISSRKVTGLEKFAAFGAIFYLIMPFDLIPDHIPVFGLLDDYAVLSLAGAFYLNRFPFLKK